MKIKAEKAVELREEAVEKFGEAEINSLKSGWVFPSSEPKKEILLAAKSDDKILVGVQETATWCGSKYWKRQEMVSLELIKADEEDLYSGATLFLSFQLKQSKDD